MNRINLITLGVRNMDKALSFYKALGFKTSEKADSPPIVFFNNGGSKLELFPLEFLAKDIAEDMYIEVTPKTFNGITLAYNAKSEEEVIKQLHLAESLGAKIVKPAQATTWGGFGGYFTDLDGYYWEVAYGSIWQFDEHDNLIIE